MQTTQQRSKPAIGRLIFMLLLLAVSLLYPRLTWAATTAQTACVAFEEYCTAFGGTNSSATLDGRLAPVCECSGASNPQECLLAELIACIADCEPILNVTVVNQTLACVPAN